MKSNSAVSINIPGFWFVCGVTGPLALCNSLLSALRKVYELSGKTTSPWNAPSALVQVGTDERLDAHQIMALWRELEWPLTSGTQRSE